MCDDEIQEKAHREEIALLQQRVMEQADDRRILQQQIVELRSCHHDGCP